MRYRSKRSRSWSECIRIQGVGRGEKPLGDARFDPVYAAAEDLGLAIFVHALHPVATKAIDADPAFTAMAGFPLDTGMAVASLILSGAIERYPRLRWSFSHGGGTIGSMLGRLDKGYGLTNGYGGKLSRKASEIARTLFYDSNVYDADYLRHLIRHTAPGRVHLGTDYPLDALDGGVGRVTTTLTRDGISPVTEGFILRT